MYFFYGKICIYKKNVVILHRKTKLITLQTQNIMTTEQTNQAKKVANTLEYVSNLNEWNDNHYWNLYYNDVYRFLMEIQKLDCFAANVAKTVYDRAESWAKQTRRSVMPKLSSKQAWCIACAAVENNIEL